MTTLADVLTVESVCGDYEHAITTGDIDEDSTVTEVLNALPPVECRCLATLLYFIVHLVRAVLELCFEISIAIVYHLGLGSLGDALVSLLVRSHTLNPNLGPRANYCDDRRPPGMYFMLL